MKNIYYTVEIYCEEEPTKEGLKEALRYCESDCNGTFKSIDFATRKEAIAYCKEARKHYTRKPYYDCYHKFYTGSRVIVSKTDEDGNVERIY